MHGDGTACQAFDHVTVGDEHTCAKTVDNSLYCWGNNDSGQLGDRTQEQRDVPTRINHLSVWKTVEAGGHYTRAIDEQVSVFFWGGDANVAEFASIPNYSSGRFIRRLESMAGTSLSVGYGHTCMLDLNGSSSIRCWGLNADGQLGNSTKVSQESPTSIEGTIADWRAVSAGAAHTCGISRDGQLYCWGRGVDGQLGAGDNEDVTAPQWMNGGNGLSTTELFRWAQISAGDAHTCAITSTENVNNAQPVRHLYCWGNNDYGQLDEDTLTSSNVPTRLVTLSHEWDYVSAGAKHSCGITTAGALFCWGRNEQGQLGDNTTNPSPKPKRIGTATNWVQVRAGREHTCGLNDTGGIYCWGDNRRGQLGTPGLDRREKPTPL